MIDPLLSTTEYFFCNKIDMCGLIGLAVNAVCVTEFQEDRKNGLFPFFVSVFYLTKYQLRDMKLDNTIQFRLTCVLLVMGKR